MCPVQRSAMLVLEGGKANQKSSLSAFPSLGRWRRGIRCGGAGP